MKHRHFRLLLIIIVLLFSSIDTYAAQAPKAPVKVFSLVGQSNMEGKAHVKTLESFMKDSQYQHLKDGDTWIKRNDVWVYYPRRDGVTKGPLSVGFGDSPEKIGPELGIGIELGNYFKQQVLLIKCAWGGKS